MVIPLYCLRIFNSLRYMPDTVYQKPYNKITEEGEYYAY